MNKSQEIQIRAIVRARIHRLSRERVRAYSELRMNAAAELNGRISELRKILDLIDEVES